MLAGIADPVIDNLIEKIIAADNRPNLITACRALDRAMQIALLHEPLMRANQDVEALAILANQIRGYRQLEQLRWFERWR